MKKNCLICGKVFQKLPRHSLKTWLGRVKYCSIPCRASAVGVQKIGKNLSKETKQKIRLAHLGISHLISLETRVKIRKALLGKPRSEEVKRKISIAHLGTKGHVSWTKGKTRPEISGVRHWNWKGGVTPIHHAIRTSLEYKLWRKAVYERDNYTCLECGDKTGGNLNADHVKPFAFYPELRFSVENGKTLCKPCHMQTKTYGMRQLLG